MKPRTRLGHVERRLLVGLGALGYGLAVAGTALAAPAPALDDANRAFAEGRYGEAAADFEALVAHDGYSEPLLFDLGNAYLRDGKPIRAVLAYERAQLLAPRDPAVASNLAVARAAAGTPAPAAEGMLAPRRFARVLPMNDWAWLAAGAFWTTLGVIGLAALSSRRRSWLVALGAAAATTVGASAAALAIDRVDLHRGLVMEPAPVLVSPFDSAQSAFALAAGTEVELGRARDAYLFVRDGQGRSGWVERAQLQPLIPSSS